MQAKVGPITRERLADVGHEMVLFCVLGAILSSAADSPPGFLYSSSFFSWTNRDRAINVWGARARESAAGYLDVRGQVFGPRKQYISLRRVPFEHQSFRRPTSRYHLLTRFDYFSIFLFTYLYCILFDCVVKVCSWLVLKFVLVSSWNLSMIILIDKMCFFS